MKYSRPMESNILESHQAEPFGFDLSVYEYLEFKTDLLFFRDFS